LLWHTPSLAPWSSEAFLHALTSLGKRRRNVFIPDRCLTWWSEYFPGRWKVGVPVPVLTPPQDPGQLEGKTESACPQAGDPRQMWQPSLSMSGFKTFPSLSFPVS